MSFSKDLNYGYVIVMPANELEADARYFKGGVRDLYIDSVNPKHIKGVFVCIQTPDFIPNTIVEYCKRIKDRGLDLILSVNYNVDDPNQNTDLLKQSKQITPKLAMVNHFRTMEFTGNSKLAERYYKFACEQGIEWVCFPTHGTLCRDMSRKWRLRNFLVQNNILSICACGYILGGYLYDDFTIPDQCLTSLKSKNLNKLFGLTIEKFQEYLRPLNILSGVGGSRGLAAGSYVYNKRLGFKGMIGYMPYNLSGADKVRVNDPPSEYPEYCGARREHRPKNQAELKHPKDIKVRDEYVTFAWDNTVAMPRWDFDKNCWDMGEKTSFKMIKAMCYYFREGYHIAIVTSRSEEKEKEMSKNKEVVIGAHKYSFCIDSVRHGAEQLPIKDVFFTNGEAKGPILKQIKSVLHYDHDDKQIESACQHGIRTKKFAINPPKHEPITYYNLATCFK